MQFEFPKHQNSIIKVVGVGGGGGNAVNNMFEKGIEGVDFMVCNTDMQALNNSDIPIKIRLGAAQTEGLGAGANPEVGRKAAVESIDEVQELMGTNTKMVFITAGLGGGTGTGAAPVISRMAKENGILTVGIVTTPFKFEGPKRSLQAEAGLQELEEFVDTLIVIDNNNLHKILGSNITMRKAFEEADKVLCDAARGIAEIITTEGYINVDFADVCTIMREGGRALMGTAVAEGEDRASQAVQEAINSPLLENNGVKGSRAIIVNITASEDSLRMDETTSIVEQVQESAGQDANIIYGIVYDESMADSLRVTVIATRFEEEVMQQPVEVPVREARRATLEEELPQQRTSERRLDRREREERIKRLNSKVYDLHDPESLNGLESTPAYLRKRVTLDTDMNERPSYSRTSVDEDYENNYRLRENNSFLHDNVD
ncbi:MAG: cell division protein FtsZ [Bacteroidota bacterium]